MRSNNTVTATSAVATVTLESGIVLRRWHGRLVVQADNPTRTQRAEAKRLMANYDAREREDCIVCDNLANHEARDRFYMIERGELSPNATICSRRTWNWMQRRRQARAAAGAEPAASDHREKALDGIGGR